MKIFDNLITYKDNIAVITDDNKKITYEELLFFADDLYSIINRRCLIFILCENSLGSLIGYVSFLRNGIVPLMLDKNININLLMNLINIYKPDYIYAPKYGSTLEPIHYTATTYYDKNNYVLIQTNYGDSFPLYDDLALLLTTSGSTGSPKFVRLSYKNIYANTQSIIEYLDLNLQERPITTLPMYYTYGLSIINTHLTVGATLLLTQKTLVEKEFWTFFKTSKATSFGGVPFTYEMLKKLRFLNMNLSSLKMITQAGGKLSFDLTKEFSEFAIKKNIKFFVMYGQTEATARMSYLDPQYSLEKCGSMGKAIPNGEFKLIDEEGNIINNSNITGELVYKGDNVSLGYTECGEDLIKEDENNGILFTGDMAKRDEDGFYYITGRKKRFIKIFGNRINLDEIEQLIKTIATECACSGNDDKLFVYLTSDEKKEEIKKLLFDQLSLHNASFEIKIVDSIPKSESGKVLYNLL
jgi:long-chain acyl-CoA synthetase